MNILMVIYVVGPSLSFLCHSLLCSTHVTAIKDQNPDASEESVALTHFNEFANWFKDHVSLQISLYGLTIADKTFLLCS